MVYKKGMEGTLLPLLLRGVNYRLSIERGQRGKPCTFLALKARFTGLVGTPHATGQGRASGSEGTLLPLLLKEVNYRLSRERGQRGSITMPMLPISHLGNIPMLAQVNNWYRNHGNMWG